MSFDLEDAKKRGGRTKAGDPADEGAMKPQHSTANLGAKLMGRDAEIERLKATNAALVEALGHALEFLGTCARDALEGRVVNDDGVYEDGFTDIELVPDGSYMMSQAKAALAKARAEMGGDGE